MEMLSSLDEKTRNAAINSGMRRDPILFARWVFPDYCRLPFAPMHRMLFRWHMEMGALPIPQRRGRRYVLAAPRGSAKSTVTSLVLPTHDILYERETYILLLSATERQACQRLREIRRRLEQPLGDFFNLPGTKRLRFTTNRLNWKRIQVDAYGAGAEIRGISSNGYRPTKIILDDAEASSAARSARTREHLIEWFTEIVEHLGDIYTNIIAIGTVLHRKSLLTTLMERPDFQSHLAKSIESFSTREDLWSEWRRLLQVRSDENRRATARAFFCDNREAMLQGTKVLWSEKEDYEELMAQLTLQGRRAFYQEKQNTPLGDEDSLFDVAGALRGVYADDDLQIVSEDGTMVRVFTNARIDGRRFGYLDAALGKGRTTKRGDFSALATVVLLADGTLFAESLWAKRAAPTEQVKRLFDQHEATPYERLGIEGTGFQELLMLPIEDERRKRIAQSRRADLPTCVVHPKRSKAARIGTLEPLLSNGTLVLGSALAEELWDELSTWPRSEHDDALDALAGAVELAHGSFHTACGKTGKPRTRLPGGF